MLKVVNRKSKDNNCKTDLEVLKKDLTRSDENLAVLDSLKTYVLVANI